MLRGAARSALCTAFVALTTFALGAGGCNEILGTENAVYAPDGSTPPASPPQPQPQPQPEDGPVGAAGDASDGSEASETPAGGDAPPELVPMLFFDAGTDDEGS